MHDNFLDEENPFLSKSVRATSQASRRPRQPHTTRILDDHEENPFLTSNKALATSVQESPSGPSHGVENTRSLRHERGHSEASNAQTKPRENQSDYRNATMDDLKRTRKELKAWEADFKATHQRSATQDDIAKDEAMVKKYRTYNKIKKALAAHPPQDKNGSGQNLAHRSDTKGFADPPSTSYFPQTPTKRSRTLHIAARARTPSRTPRGRQDIEYVSPRKIVNTSGFMSPSRGSKSGEDRHQFLASMTSTTPKSRRMDPGLMSPSRGRGRKALLLSPSFKSPSSLFTIKEQVKEVTDGDAREVGQDAITHSTQDIQLHNTFLSGPSTPSRMPRTPTANGRSLLFSPSLFRSPSRPRTSPLFGGMNNRRPKRALRPAAPVVEDLEPIQGLSLSQHERSPILDNLDHIDAAPEAGFLKSPLLSTPQKSGAAKAARSLFRRSSTSYPTSPSSRLALPDAFQSRLDYVRQHSIAAHRGNQEYGHSEDASQSSNLFSASTAALSDMEPSSLQESVHDAMDSMSLRDRQRRFSNSSPSTKRIMHGFDNDVDTHSDQQDDTALYSPVIDHVEIGRNTLPGLMTPFRRSTNRVISPRTPSQQPSLTFSQPTPGSAKSEVDIFVVPPGFHSHNRRRQVRSTLFIPSQEEDEQFEREFLGPKHGKIQRTTTETGGVPIDPSNALEGNIANSIATPGDREAERANEDDWEELESKGEDMERNPFASEPQAPSRKKYTQKRSTRLHRIAVAPSEKAEPVRPKRTTTRSRKSKAESVDAPAIQDQRSKNAEESVPAGDQTTGDDKSAKAKAVTADDSGAFGWANSNKPMVKSDRRMGGVGLGRAGPRKPPSKFGGSSSDGNFVAYNLQRGGFKKGGARGKSRFGGSKFGGYNSAAGGPGTGRTLFDEDSWREEFDKDFDDATLAMNLADGGIDEEDEDDGVPWYGNVNDVTDPYIVTISQKYLKARLGDAGDPDEYLRELELQHSLEDSEILPGKETPEFRVNMEYVLRKLWGYPSFRDGQFDSIKRVLHHESSLLVLPTGSGKSLSYQLPAYIFSKLGIPSLTLVISPMISLMYDQVKCLPPGLAGACWTSVEQSPAQFKNFMDRLTSNAIKILFISPEKLQSQSFLALVRTRRIPPISFVCVDEVHCLSEWSHNFRPAYLLLNHVLKTDLKSPCVLGLTGTATEGTKDSICAMLDIDRTTGVLSGPVIRENLAMTVSLEVDREPALFNLLQSPRFATMDSILIYVMKQAQADALAAFLRVRNFSAESYHAGKSPADRQRIQQRFMNDGPQRGSVSGAKIGPGSSSVGSAGGIRILVATIAFGLGLNKSNIRSVIHYCMPKSLENYIQEIGRSGRDGMKAYCHMFLNQDDYLRLRSLAYADGMDWGTVLRLIKKLFSRKGIASAARAVSKKRRSVKMDEDEDDMNDIAAESDMEAVDRAGTKKRIQNDRQPLNLKSSAAGSKATSKQHNLVTSTASILVIPPTLGLSSNGERTYSKRVVILREELVEEEFDIKKEVLATLLSYVELEPSHPIKVVGSISAKCTVKFLQASEALSELADNVPLVDMIMKQGVLTGHNNNSGSSYGKGRKGNKTGLAGTTLSMAYCCDTMSLCQTSGLTYTELVQELQLWKRKKWVVYEMTDPALCVEVLVEPADCMQKQRRNERDAFHKSQQEGRRDMRTNTDMDVDAGTGESEDERDADSYEKDHDNFIVMLTDRLYRKLCAVERVGVAKVDQVYELFQSTATATWQQQAVFKAGFQGTGDEAEDDEEDLKDGAESSEFDDDVDAEYIRMHERAKAKAKARSSSWRTSGVSEAEMILRHGIQEYFAKRSGEGIGGVTAEEDLLPTESERAGLGDKTMQLYTYESTVVTSLQAKWRSAVEVDLKVFLNQQWQQQQRNQEPGELNGAGKAIDSPRVVSRIFHGIQSPCFSALEWSRHKYWAKYVHFDFAQLMQMADRITKEQRRQRFAQLQQQQE